MHLNDFALKHEKSIAFLIAVLTVVGAWSYTAVPAAIFPNMSFARIDVVADAGDLPPERVRVAVTQPLERAFAGLPSVARTLATSAQGSGEVFVEFDPSTDPQVDLQRVFQAISSTREQLPQNVKVDATIVNANTEPVESYGFVSDSLSQTVIRELIQQNLVPQFYGTPGLARMLVVGGPQREYRVALNPAALAAHGMSAADVSRAIADANTIVSPGVVSTYAQRNVLLVDSSISGADSLGNVMIPDAQHNPIPLRALGSVTLGVAPETFQASFDARHGVVLNFYGLPGADIVKMVDAIDARMTPLAGGLPVGVTVKKYWDQTTLIRDSQKSLRDAIAIGAVLAILVILAFLRNLRMTLIAALVIPIAMATTILAIGRMGQTLNLMSMGGLAVAVGLIIDDAIVVIENVARNLHLYAGETKREIIARSMSELIGPMTASTLTTVVVFVPMALLTGVSGFFFRALAITLGTALIVSLGLAIFVTPIFAHRMIVPGQAHDDTGLIARLLSRYEPLLRWALSHRPSVYAASGIVLAVTIVLLQLLPSDFLPKLDEGQAELRFSMPVGATLEATDAAATQLERVALADPAVKSAERLNGIDTNGFSPTPVRTGTMRFVFKARNQRDGYDVISDRMRDAMQAAVPAATLSFHQILEDMLDDLSGAPAPVEVTLRGNDQNTLIAVSNKVTDAIGKLPGVTDAFNGVNYDDPTQPVAPNAARLAALGMSNGDLADAIAATTQGSVATSIASSTQLVPVRLAMSGGLVATPDGAVPLSVVASAKPRVLTSDIVEENGQRVDLVTSGYGGRSLSSVVTEIRDALGKVRMPPGYSWQIGGAYRAQQQSFREFALVVAIAIALVFFVMLATFRSFRLPLVILTAIPLALIGVAAGLFVTQTPFNVSSFMGLLLLVGLIVKNGILLIDVANRQRSEGASIEDALVTAGRRRLRPIVMTTFAAIGGLLPLAFGLGSGSEMEKPLAIAVIGGLSTATIFTLVAIPVLYAGFTRGGKPA